MEIAAAENLSEKDIRLLRIAVLYHDAGFIYVYKNHEERGCEMAKKHLPAFGFNNKEIDAICKMIMATQLEKIVCDADLAYLGGKNFSSTAQSLFRELKIYADVKDENEWNKIQKNFLKQHHYFTKFCIDNKEPQKKKYLKEIR